ncbi:class I SAM-dependent DNA methyltransferase [Nocardioides KLBMP 9356]|uniref:site-specific DNA-methyltransferase (adenine-specific) n=1 Tax=Nocardioides potassii TaxID=2911371 RepID=A0ABS9H831_9ACTN|nr:class I SAM-dependent DNA methyltransferase [Nocardioides potassii]MCF6376422.1 class I SAM-dependent DNA methyltransferase [Nocardioides potassii]
MSASDAIVVVGDWISEHYLTTDATKESFKARVLARRKEWDAAESETARSRFTGARVDLLARLARLEEDPTLAADLRSDVLRVLRYDAIGLHHEKTGPLTLVRQASLADVAGVALVAAKPVDSVEDLLAKDEETLAEAFVDEDSGDAVTSVSRLLSRLFVQEHGPAFALVLAGRVLLVAEKERWPEGRYLSLDLQLVCERNDGTKGGEVDRALTCLAAESLAPDAEGTIWWHEVLEESVKHTVGVSQDLREGVRLSIELIANEVVTRRREQGLEPLPQSEAQQLAKQSLRYLYRILFLLYAEASPELGVMPVGAPEYDAGYSLDRLRELVQVPLTSPQAERGTHLYDSLGVLFRLVDQGYQPTVTEDEGLLEPLEFRSLRADLFHPDAVAHIAEVGLGNARLQEVLQHLLLSKEARGRDRGFISYAELGINQLGAVYEGLMSYTGRFAETDLYEVAKGGDSSKGSWLVPVDRSGDIDEKDFVRTEDKVTGELKPVHHRRGAFVFRLAGRERQQSASYYTPEVLTKFTVGQALEELLDQDGQRTTAEEILSLTVCEPALGSGAFAIEAVRQLAAEYLTRRQDELGERIDPEAYPRELQKVKAYLALHNVYGVDLNATAVELAEISLWLDTMVEGLHAPWFGLHLKRGNSLVGARRAGFSKSDLQSKTWLTTVPTDISDRPGLIHHFLVPAEGWGAAADVGKEIKELVPDAVADLKTWRRSTRSKPTKKQLDHLTELAARVETLWGIASRRLEIAEQQASRDIPLWGRDHEETAEAYVTREQIEESLADHDGAYQRLKLVMDAWCALWFWPLTEETIEPPTVDEWYGTLRQILGGETMRAKTRSQGDATIGDIADWDELADAEHNDWVLAGADRVEKVLADHPWLAVTQSVAMRQGFFHWHLDFTQLFDQQGGFDLQVGNPPWVRPDWDETSALAEHDVRFALEGKMASERRQVLARTVLCNPAARVEVVGLASDQMALREAVSAPILFPYLAGLRPDLYRCFIESTWGRQSGRGVIALIHPETHFTDEKAGVLRAGAYRRLRRHWQFINELVLFEIHHLVVYGVHVYGLERDAPEFLMASSLYHPDTVERSLQHGGEGTEPGLKDMEGKWDVRPHRSRILRVDKETLATWHTLVEPEDVPVLHSRMVYSVNSSSAETLRVIARAPRLRGLDLSFSPGLIETQARKDGLIELQWGRPTDWSDVVLMGPNFHVAAPFYKSPNETMANNLDWSQVDLEGLSVDEVPVTSYKRATDAPTYRNAYQAWSGSRSLDLPRIAWRGMAANTGERTLIPILLPPGPGHINAVFSAGSPGVALRDLVLALGSMTSLIADFSIRCAPKSGVYMSAANRVPIVTARDLLADQLVLRVLRLNCIVSEYAQIWNRSLGAINLKDEWTGGLAYRGRPELAGVSTDWLPNAPLRRASDRRQAQVEIDAIVAVTLGLSADELATIYRTQFPVLYGYDRNTYFYDANGRLVPNSVLTVWRKKGNDISLDERTATNASGNTYTYELPFVTLDREADMRRAYAHFEKVLAERGGA